MSSQGPDELAGKYLRNQPMETKIELEGFTVCLKNLLAQKIGSRILLLADFKRGLHRKFFSRLVI